MGEQRVSSTDARRGRVLIVSDDRVLLRMCVGALCDEHDVLVASSGRDAVEKLRAGTELDVMLCDITERDLYGIKFHAAVWQIAPRSIHRIVFLVDEQLGDLTTGFLESVRNQVLHKPLVIPQLRELVRSRSAQVPR